MLWVLTVPPEVKPEFPELKSPNEPDEPELKELDPDEVWTVDPVPEKLVVAIGALVVVVGALVVVVVVVRGILVFTGELIEVRPADDENEEEEEEDEVVVEVWLEPEDPNPKSDEVTPKFEDVEDAEDGLWVSENKTHFPLTWLNPDLQKRQI